MEMDTNEFAAIAEAEPLTEHGVGNLSGEDISDNPDFVEEEFEKYFEEYLTSEESASDIAEPEEAPTTEPEQTAAEEDEQTEAPTTEQTEAKPEKIRVKVKRDHQEQEVDIDRDELPGLWQKAENYDRLESKYKKQNEMVQSMSALAKQMGFDDAKAMVEHAFSKNRDERVQELVDEGTAREIAEDFIDRKDRESMEASRLVDEKPNESAPDYKIQVDELFAVRPDLRGKIEKFPDEVIKAVVKEKIPLRTAYAEWEARTAKAEQERLKKENELFAQTAQTATRAPVRGTNGGQADKAEKLDPFLSAFRNAKY